MEKPMGRAALSVDEACAYVGIGRAHFYRLMDRGEIPSFNIGRRRLVRKEDLDRFIQERLAEAGYQSSQGA